LGDLYEVNNSKNPGKATAEKLFNGLLETLASHQAM